MKKRIERRIEKQREKEPTKKIKSYGNRKK